MPCILTHECEPRLTLCIAGDVFIELYRGMELSYLALGEWDGHCGLHCDLVRPLVAGLYADFAYSFQLAATNDIGQSDWSLMVSVQLPAKRKISDVAR